LAGRNISGGTVSVVFHGLVVVWVGLLIAGCSSPVAVGQSNKAVGYSRKLQRVLVATNLQSPGMTATHKNALIRPEELRQAFDAKWAPLGAAVEVVDLDAAPNKPEALAAAIARVSPTQVIELKTASYTTTSYVLDGYSISANLYDPVAKKSSAGRWSILSPSASQVGCEAAPWEARSRIRTMQTSSSMP
jgi:hypothetical protein